jgi:hypothetical protein
MTVLGPADVDAFVEHGFCVLRGAFTAKQAAAARTVVWRRMAQQAGIRRDDPATWPDSYDIEERPAAPEVLGCFTDRLVAAVERLVGAGRWNGLRTWGFWPVNFSYGAHELDPVPTHGWHVDGNWFRHTPDAPEQGLLLVGLFSDVEPGGGAAMVAAGSHRRAARVLAAHPAGLTHRELFDAVLAEPIGTITELTGAAGDVVLRPPAPVPRPWLQAPRAAALHLDTEAGLRAPLRLDRLDDADHSVLEHSLRAALAGPPPVFANPVRCRF